MKTGWLAAVLFSGCLCNVQVPSDCSVQGGVCQGGGVSCTRELEGLCQVPGDVCCWVPDAAGGGNAGGGSASGGGTASGGGSAAGGGSTGGGTTEACLVEGGACQPSGQACGLVLNGPCPTGQTCCWVPDAAGGGSAAGGGGADSTCPAGVGQCAPEATCQGTSLTQYTCGGDTVCCPVMQCDQTTVTSFVNANKGCSVDQDCTPLCLLGASCDERAVDAAGAAAFASTFSGCDFAQCDIACFGAHCTMGACSP